MAFANPLVVTVNGTAVSSPKVGSSYLNGSYLGSDASLGDLKTDIFHDMSKRNRHTIRVTQSKLTADPFVPSQNVQSSASVRFTVDAPAQGFSAAELTNLGKALVALLSVSSSAAVGDLMSWQS